MKFIAKTGLFLILISYNLTLGQTSNWEIVGKMPFRISGSEAVVIDSTIYFLGGYSDTLQRVVDWIYAYSPNTNSWKFVGHMRKNRVNFIADKIGNKIYYVGGEANTLARASGTLEVFDCKTLNTTIVDTNIEFNRLHSTGLIKDSILYIIGGMVNSPPGETTPYIIEYSIPLKNVAYNFIPTFPGMRVEQMPTYLFKNIYIFGGLFNTVSSDIYSYGISDHHLVLENPSLLRPRANGRAVRLGDSNRVIILGGYNEINNALNSVELYEFTDTLQFMGHPVQPMNFKRNNLMAVNFYGTIYAFGGLDEFGNPVDKVERIQFITDIKGTENQTPTEFKIEQNYPNPFNLATIIRYYVPETSIISIKVYDIMGREVANLIDEEKLSGNYIISFNGSGLASGVYYYRINGTAEGRTSGNSFTETKKMILLK